MLVKVFLNLKNFLVGLPGIRQQQRFHPFIVGLQKPEVFKLVVIYEIILAAIDKPK